MKWKPGYLLTAGLLVSLAFITTGCPDVCCNTARGGGSILIDDGSVKAPHKATFGFQMVCKKDANGVPVVTGQLEYQDHRPWNAMSVSFHGTLNEPLDATDAMGVAIECGPKTGAFKGTYRPQPESLGAGGTFMVEVEDVGKEGPSDGDKFRISVQDGVFAGYAQSGTLAGGNIKTF